MKKNLTTMTAAVLLCCWSLHATAAPGWSATGLTVMPENAGKVVAAFDALFDSKVGRKLPGGLVPMVLVLLQRLRRDRLQIPAEQPVDRAERSRLLLPDHPDGLEDRPLAQWHQRLGQH